MKKMAHTAFIFGVDGALGVPKRDGYRATCNQAFAKAGLDWCRDVGLYGELLAVTGGSGCRPGITAELLTQGEIPLFDLSPAGK